LTLGATRGPPAKPPFGSGLTQSEPTWEKKIDHAAIDIHKPSAHGQIGMLSTARSRRVTRPRCPRCKLRQSSRDSDACPCNTAKRCTCCDHCRRDCLLDAKGSQLKRS